jgi:hypothetical protein
LQLVWLRAKSKRSYFFTLAREFMLQAFCVALFAILGFAVAILSNGLAAQINVHFLVPFTLIAINYVLFWVGLSALCFLINLKYGDVIAIMTAMVLSAVLLLVDSQIEFFSILTAGNVNSCIVGLVISIVWALSNLCFAYSVIRKIDLL